jgi:hypothetical protein
MSDQTMTLLIPATAMSLFIWNRIPVLIGTMVLVLLPTLMSS